MKTVIRIVMFQFHKVQLTLLVAVISIVRIMFQFHKVQLTRLSQYTHST